MRNDDEPLDFIWFYGPWNPQTNPLLEKCSEMRIGHFPTLRATLQPHVPTAADAASFPAGWPGQSSTILRSFGWTPVIDKSSTNLQNGSSGLRKYLKFPISSIILVPKFGFQTWKCREKPWKNHPLVNHSCPPIPGPWLRMASHGFAWLRVRPATGPNLCSRWEISGNRWNIYGTSMEHLWYFYGNRWLRVKTMKIYSKWCGNLWWLVKMDLYKLRQTDWSSDAT